MWRLTLIVCILFSIVSCAPEEDYIIEYQDEQLNYDYTRTSSELH